MDSKNGHVRLAPRARDLAMVSHMRTKVTVLLSSLNWQVFFERWWFIFVGIVEKWEGHIW